LAFFSSFNPYLGTYIYAYLPVLVVNVAYDDVVADVVHAVAASIAAATASTAATVAIAAGGVDAYLRFYLYLNLGIYVCFPIDIKICPTE